MLLSVIVYLSALILRTGAFTPPPLTVSKRGACRPASVIPSFLRSSPTDSLSSLTVVALKDLLRERGLKVSGLKRELIDRLAASQDDKAVTIASKDNGASADDEKVTYIPLLSAVHIKILRKEAGRRRRTRSLRQVWAVEELDSALDKEELVECRGIALEAKAKGVTDAIYDIAATVGAPIVERKGHSAVFYREDGGGKGIRLFHSNNADGMQFAKRPRTERDSRGKPVSGG